MDIELASTATPAASSTLEVDSHTETLIELSTIAKMSTHTAYPDTADDAQVREACRKQAQAEILSKVKLSVRNGTSMTGGQPTSSRPSKAKSPKKGKAANKKKSKNDADSGDSPSTEKTKKKKKRNVFKKAIRKIFCRRKKTKHKDSTEKPTEKAEEPKEEIGGVDEEVSEAEPQEQLEAYRANGLLPWGPALSEAFGWDDAKAAEVLEEIRRDQIRRGKAPAPREELKEMPADDGSLLSEEDPGDSAEYGFYRSARKLEKLLGRPLTRAAFRTVRGAFTQRLHLPLSDSYEDREPDPSSRRGERWSNGTVDTRSTFWIENERRALKGLTPGPAPASKPASLGGIPNPTSPQSAAYGPGDLPGGDPPFRASASLGESEYDAESVRAGSIDRSSITDEALGLLPRMIDVWGPPVPQQALQGLPRDAQVDILREELDRISSEFTLYWMLAHRGVTLGRKVEEEMGLPGFARGLCLFQFVRIRCARRRHVESDEDSDEAGPNRPAFTTIPRPTSIASIAPPSTNAHVDRSDNEREGVERDTTLDMPAVTPEGRPLSTLSDVWRAGETKRIEHGTVLDADDLPRTKSGMWMLEKLTSFTKSFKHHRKQSGDERENGLGLTISNPDNGITIEELLKQDKEERESQKANTRNFRKSILYVFSKDKLRLDFTVQGNGDSSSQKVGAKEKASKRDSGIVFNKMWEDINHGVAAKLLDVSRGHRPASIFAKGFLDGIRKTPKHTPTGPDFQATMQSYFVGNLPNGPEKRALGLGASQAVTNHNLRQKELLEKRVAVREALGMPSSITPLELASIPDQVIVCEPGFVFPRRDKDITVKPAIEQGSSCIRLPTMNLGGSVNVNMFDNIGQDINMGDTRMPIAPSEVAGTTRDGRDIVLDDDFPISISEDDDGTSSSSITSSSQQTGSDEHFYSDSQESSYDSHDLSEDSQDYSVDSRDQSEDSTSNSDDYSDSQSDGRSYTNSDDLYQDDSRRSSQVYSENDSEAQSSSQDYSDSDSEELSNTQDYSNEGSSQNLRDSAGDNTDEDSFDEDHFRSHSGESSENMNEDSDEISQALSDIIGNYASEHEEVGGELQRELTEPKSQANDERAIQSPRLRVLYVTGEVRNLDSDEKLNTSKLSEVEASNDLHSLAATLKECDELLKECEGLLEGHQLDEEIKSTEEDNRFEEAEVAKADSKPKFVSEILSTAHGGDILIDSRTPTEIIGSVTHTRTNTETSAGIHVGLPLSRTDSRASQQVFGLHDAGVGPPSPHHYHRRSSFGTPSSPVTPSPTPREMHQRMGSRAEAYFIHRMPQDFLAQHAARANQSLESNEFHSRANISRRPRIRRCNDPSKDV
ncbi:hypothetical protein TWF694_000294 [Orbilia ellipsospora]|uniref:Uncharacterized protein n=1 Tax=Orbilia ellipsospora TaxID=2528407 RepID=A0AAV9XN59_9PEZI